MSTLERTTCYDDAFFDSQVGGALRSARAVVPIVLELVQIQSVLDLGCGRGAWLSVFDELGVTDCCGVDGDYVDWSKILIDRSKFLGADVSKPIVLGRQFDLALCLEVGEHLPKRASKVLVESLTAAAPLVLFSAAIPGQKGTSHINEQWPEYWERYFNERGYQRLDLIRHKIWQNRDVEWWYQQNLYLYATGSILEELRGIASTMPTSNPGLELIKEEVLANYKTFRKLLRETVRAGVRAVRNRIIP